ncbi:hypothetical protein H0266_06650 [Halobacillus locisalis]|uniref:Uncharacterized protein n=1 Tax=Halobacillus locisalis TaxID=220753 RepID=A0A838CR88_9BACI|nr:hypothetical protein [Halobacillus locisalis]MBA2174587.1 hypothetical protein [Halobacillus locisalis]
MSECGLCNGWVEDNKPCPRCKGTMYDRGRVTDFLDEYSPYLDLDYTDLVDGELNSSVTEECVHYFVCEECGFHDIQAK